MMFFTTPGHPSPKPLPTLAVLALWCLAGANAQTRQDPPSAQPAQSLRWEVAVVNTNATFYLAPQTVRRQGDLRRFSSALDYRQPQVTYDGKAFVSTQSEMVINCSDWTAQVTQVVYYSGHMLAGQLVFRDAEETEWKDILAQSPIERMARKLC